MNLRTYTSTLSAAGTNDNASFALAAPAPVVSDMDLHIPPGTMTQLAHGAAPGTGVIDDIDGNARDPVAPESALNQLQWSGIANAYTHGNGHSYAYAYTDGGPSATFTPTPTATAINIHTYVLRQRLQDRLPARHS